MPPKKHSKRHPAKSLGDVTLNDFANSSVPKERLKKSTNNVNVVLKQEVEKSWDTKDLEEFEGDLVPKKNTDGTISYVIRKPEPRARKKTISNSDKKNNKENDVGKNYPIDIWYILSEYICPEDVGIFAAICKTSFEVICSSRFWFHLYRRYYRSVPNMPEFLQPEYLVRKYGLRTNVIRALYFMYQPFIDRIKPITIFEEHPDSLKRFECYLLWQVKKNQIYHYYFKMKQKVVGTLHHSRSKSHQPDLLEILDDISVNPDENCRVLEVSCLNCDPIPPVLGLTLTTVSLTLSSAPRFRYHRLQLGFGSGINTSRKSSAEIIVILDPVINIKILDWWDPHYPYNSYMEKLFNQD